MVSILKTQWEKETTGVSTLLENLSPFLSNLRLSSANSFSLGEPKICHLGKCYAAFLERMDLICEVK